MAMTVTQQQDADSRFYMRAVGDHSDDVFTAWTVYGQEGPEVYVQNWSIHGSYGNDSLTASRGDDFLQGSTGNDSLWGLAGYDELWGGDGNDVLYGGAGKDELWGGDNNDQLFGGTGRDHLDGGYGNDYLDGNEGYDVMTGGAGDDVYVISDYTDKFDNSIPGDRVIEYAGGGTDTVYSYANVVGLDANVENLRMMVGAATAYGNALNNSMIGSGYDDNLRGNDGNDTLEGQAGNDYLEGDNGRDTLNGSEGNDVLRGGAGADVLRGGSGNDIFRFTETSEFAGWSSETGWSYDTITDFVKGQDKIDLSIIDADSTVFGNQAFNFMGNKPAFIWPGDLWVVQGNGMSSVYADVNGDGAADIHLDLIGVSGLTASDFLL